MKRAFQLLLITTFIFGILSTSTNAQSNVDLEKKWSRIQIDKNNTTPINQDYRYIPGPPVYQKYDIGETDVLVMPNYRVLPGTNTTQSELSIDIHPLNPMIMLASANATNWPFSSIWGTGVYWTTNGGTNWGGANNPQPLFGSTNYGDPSSAIGPNGYFYEGYITLAGGMGVATSTNNGTNWTSSIVSSASSDDKNHLMVDKKVGSPYENRVYNTWTDFNGGANNNQIVFKSSTNFGATWGTLINLSGSLNPGSHAQGCNVQTGPIGEVYVTFAIYDGWPGGEDAIGFAKSTDGGVTWTKTRIYSALNFGIRGNLKPTSIRVSSFPSMSVDRSGGVNNGNIYITWPQRGVTPAGSDPDIVLIRSTNGGTTWSAPVRVNDDPINNGKEQYYPWCTVDQNTGQLNLVWYDNRNTTNDSTGVFMATSDDGGLTFDNFQVSDKNFRPKPISGLADGYQGDYIGIAAANNKAYPFWADDRTGNYQAWITEVTFGPSIDHTPLQKTENLTGPYAVNAVITSVNPLIPGSIKVYWGRGAGVLSDSLVMTNTGGNNYTANIPGNGSNAVYNYYIAATDNQGFTSTSPGGAPVNYYTFTAETDVTAPTIVHSPIPDTLHAKWPIDVYANVTDVWGLQSVQCEFRINGGSITTITMNVVSDDTYKGTFSGSVNIGDLVEYRIKATDNSNQHNVGYSPAAGYHAFNLLDDLNAPVITHTAIGNTPQVRWPINVTADATDDVGVSTVECEFRVNGGSINTVSMPIVSGNTYRGTFTGTVAIGDLVEYRIKATDVSPQSNIAYSPASGYNSFNIVDILGFVLVVDNDAVLLDRISTEKEYHEADASIPLGASATLFNTTLTTAGYLVEEVTWAAFNPANLNNYDLVILAAGLNEGTMFNDQTKRTAITNWTLAGGKTIVEGGEVGYQYRQTSERDLQFRRNVLNDSSWISDRTNDNLLLSTPTHPIFTTPNTITGPINVNNGGSSGWGARDEVTLLNKAGVIRIANWALGSAANPGIIVHNPNNSPDETRNIFFPFAISAFANQTVAANLIENTVAYLFRDIIPVELTAFTVNVTGNNVKLNWNTATELNNSGFDIERKSANEQFEKIGYVAGFGTTSEPKAYSFTDAKVAVGNFTYRLKQVDFDGSYEYSNEINVDVTGPAQYSLDQNYPNPFNPSTLIKYSVAQDGFVNVSIFNLLGEKVATLVNSNIKAGSYEINFNASQLSSGVYFYSIEASDFKAVRKMLLMK
jgi:hypothetical protein